MANGTVKFFNSAKGFGFITPNDNTGDIFFHVSNLEQGVSEPKDGDKVEYDKGMGKKGAEATNVKVRH